MRHHRPVLLPTLAAILATSGLAAQPALARQDAAKPGAEASAQETITLRDIYGRKSHFGKRARAMSWSFDDRYLAYLWNAYDDKGYDLWLYDSKEKKSRRLTSPELFKGFDRSLKEIIERYKKDKDEDARRKTLSREERYKLEDEDERKDRDLKEPRKEYAGVSEFTWAHKSNQMLFVYRGDIFKLDIDSADPTRITHTSEGESEPKYTRDDKGLFFSRGSARFRMAFDSASVEQLNPELPDGYRYSGMRISPDETRALVFGNKDTGKSREVTYITYRDRFAAARTTARDVADDPFNSEQALFIVDLTDDPKKTPDADGKPWMICKLPAGEELQQLVVHEEPWSPDSKRVAFATWKRNKRELEVLVADWDARKTTTVYKATANGEHTSPTMTDPFFTPDGSKLVATLEQSGYRQAWIIDPLTAGATQLTRGDFELIPLKVTPDGKTLLARALREDPSRSNLYRVSMGDGSLDLMGGKEGNHSGYELSHDMKRVAYINTSWSTMPEMYVNGTDGKGETEVTSSQPGTFERVRKIVPELFTYKNRVGQVVHAAMFKSPAWKKGEKRPLLVYVYGGPLGEGHTVEDGSWGPDGFTFPMYMAYKYNYLCIAVDPRGSSGYGGLFGGANFEQPGKDQVEDLTDGVKWVKENYGIDETKVGVHGWSFGGFQTQMCMYTATDVFTLGIAGAGPTEWQNYNNWYSGGVIGPAKVGKPDELDKYSLTKLAKNLKGNLMLLHGLEDTNVLAQDTIKVYRELMKEGKGPLVELVLDPTGGHGLGGDINTRERFSIYEEYLVRHWGK